MSTPDQQNPSQEAPLPRPVAGWREVTSDSAAGLLAVVFLLLPLIRSSALEDSFITPKILFIAPFAVVLAAIAAVRALRGTLTPLASKAVPAAFGVFLAFNVASLAWSGSRPLTYYAMTYFALLGILLLSCCRFLRTPGMFAGALWAGILAAAVTGGWTLFEDVYKPLATISRLPDWRGHLAAGLGNSGHIAGLIGMFLPAALLLMGQSKRFPFLITLLLIPMLGAMVVTWSVGSSGSTIAAMLIWLPVAYAVLKTELRWRRYFIFIAIGLAAAAFYMLPNPLNPHPLGLLKEAFGSQRWAEGWPTRVVIWKTSLHMIGEHPILGVGAGNFTFDYVQQIVPSVIADPALSKYAGSFTNDAHNEYLQVWAETGIFSLVAYIGLFVCFFYVLACRLRASADSMTKCVLIASGAGVTVFLLDSLMTFPLRLPANAGALMLFLSAPCALAAGDQKLRRSSKSTLLMGTVLVLAVSLAASVVWGKRGAAEFYLKQARSLAEASFVDNGQRISVWDMADTQFDTGAQWLARGDTSKARYALGASQTMAKSPIITSAIPVYVTSLSWDPSYSNASSRFGALLLMRGEYDKAIPTLQRTLRTLQTPEVYERIGFAYWLKGDMANARKYWEVCAIRRPQMQDYYKGLIAQAK